ncbi:MAG: lamin tail domain-containing protein, partial [Nannocystaceae bacterium]|nr:lamin tail domain-containing protein [Nannocystaceae bacterium]
MGRPATLGFASGDLGCADDCTFDTAACESCGNAVIDDGEDCEGDDLADATCQSIGMGFTAGTLGCDASCGFDTAGCTSVPFPAAGEVIVSEIMPDPTVVADSDGEWFELHNPSATETYELSGCEVSGQAGEEVISIVGDFVIAPGAYLSFAPESMVDPGFTPDFGYTENFSVANGGDIITLTCDGVTVDSVDYDTFPPEGGVSLNLDPDFFDAASNDVAENWCPGVNVYLDPDTGTPGAANDECVFPAVYTIDFCRLQDPNTIDQDAGTSVDVYGRVYVAGLTDMSNMNDLAPELSAQLGYGPDGTDPAVDAGWTWIDAAPNAGYTAVEEGDNDEYVVSLTVPVPGEYDYAYRFSGDSEGTYTYCDGQAAGNSDGYQVANAGQMTSNVVAGAFDLYF